MVKNSSYPNNYLSEKNFKLIFFGRFFLILYIIRDTDSQYFFDNKLIKHFL